MVLHLRFLRDFFLRRFASFLLAAVRRALRRGAFALVLVRDALFTVAARRCLGFAARILFCSATVSSWASEISVAVIFLATTWRERIAVLWPESAAA